MNAFRQFLRAATRDQHERVDALFGRFDLTRADGYAAFLSAQAKVLPGLETQFGEAGVWRDWTARTPALLADLHDLGEKSPDSAPAEKIQKSSELWGALYVVEGSRLGGRVLAGRVRAGLPTQFLHDGDDGRWTRFQTAMERAPELTHANAQADLLAGALKGFSAFEAAARSTLAEMVPQCERLRA